MDFNGLFAFLCLTFRVWMIKIDSVWCTLRQYCFLAALRFIDNRRLRAGVCVFAPYAHVCRVQNPAGILCGDLRFA
jgi:hypothetical protein